MNNLQEFPEYDNNIKLNDIKRHKRARTDYSTSSEVNFSPNKIFLRLKCVNKENGFAGINPYTVNLGISVSLGLKPDQIIADLEANGELILVVSHLTMLERLKTMENSTLTNTDIEFTVELDKFHNSSKGLVFVPCWNLIPIEQLKENTKDQGVLDIYRIKTYINGTSRDTNKYILTFNTTKPPKTFYTGFYPVQIEPHLPSPTSCKNCHRFNTHSTKKCKQDAVCANCGGKNHKIDECRNFTKCPLCKGKDHTATSKGCPEFIKAKKIKNLMNADILTKNMAIRKMINLIKNREFRPLEESANFLAKYPDPKVIQSPTQDQNTDNQKDVFRFSMTSSQRKTEVSETVSDITTNTKTNETTHTNLPKTCSTKQKTNKKDKDEHYTREKKKKSRSSKREPDYIKHHKCSRKKRENIDPNTKTQPPGFKKITETANENTSDIPIQESQTISENEAQILTYNPSNTSQQLTNNNINYSSVETDEHEQHTYMADDIGMTSAGEEEQD